MRRVTVYFLISKWQGSRFLQRDHLEHATAPFGYLGLSKPRWTGVTLLHLPALSRSVIKAQAEKRCPMILVLDIRSL